MREDATEQYKIILEAFEEVVEKVGSEDGDIWHVIDVLAEVRAKYLLSIVADGLLITYSLAIDIIRNNIDKRQDDIVDNRAVVLISALHNLVDFAVCQQYQMVRDLPDELTEENWAEIEKIFYMYNEIYAGVENNTVDQSAIIALAWMQMAYDNEIIQFTTQRDERVRHSHAILDGVSYPKADFPSELIPPIDYNCRCFLVQTGVMSTMGAKKADKSIEEIKNPIFSESLAKGGRVFGNSHPYFNVVKSDVSKINSTIDLVKERLVWGGDV